MGLLQPLEWIVVPEEGETLKTISGLPSVERGTIQFIPVPTTATQIALVEDDIKSLLKDSRRNRVFLIPDTDTPASLDPEDPTLTGLRQKEIFHVLENVCRATLHRFMAALQYAATKKQSMDARVIASVVKQFADTPENNACHRSVAAYDKKLADFKQANEYLNSVRRLRKTLTNVRDRHLGFDVEGTLVGSCAKPEDPLARLSYLPRPYAREMLEILRDNNNTLTLCTLAPESLLPSIAAQTRLSLPETTQIICRHQIEEMNAKNKIKNTHVKIPQLYGFDALVDDLMEMHRDDAIRAGYSGDPFVSIKSFDYREYNQLPSEKNAAIHSVAYALAYRFR